MTPRLLLFTFILFPVFLPCVHAVSQSTIEDQKSVELTVYNSNLGLVKDVRTLKLAKGEGELWFMDVASRINPVTVSAKSLNAPGEFQILDQNYEFDLMNEEKLLDKYVGKNIKLQQWNEDLSKKEVIEAKLLSNHQGQIYQINNEIFLGHPGTKILPSLPENLIAKPTLTWNFSNKSGKAHQMEVSYLTEGINWKADYVVTLASDSKTLNLSGWVTIDNQSGGTYKNARLKLIAGDVNRVYDHAMMQKSRGDVMYAMEAAAPQFQEKSFFEYHIYDLQRLVTVKDKQIKQINLLEAAHAKVEKEYLAQSGSYYYFSPNRGQMQKQKVDVSVYVKFKNAKENNLGMPLPAGILRVYQKDSDASLQFIGEDRIEHTPKNEEVEIKIGKAFDLVAEREQTDFKQISNRMHESAWEISLRNHKEEAVTLGVVEPMQGDWEVLENSHPYQKVNAQTLRFDIRIPKDQEVKIKYRVRVTT